MRSARTIAAMLPLVTTAVLGSWVPARAAGSAPLSADDGAFVVAERRVSDRLIDLVIASPALTPRGAGETARVKVRLLLPAPRVFPTQRPSANAMSTLPTLYLLHGAEAAAEPRLTYRSWTEMTGVERLTEDTNMLVVMPEGSQAGFYSDWLHDDLGVTKPRYRPRWETFHLTELRQILERRYGAGDPRAIAGLSMGGFGTLSYAGRHPGLFKAAASFSGGLDTVHDSVIVQGTLLRAGFGPDSLWGSPLLHRPIWRRHNPYDLASRLAEIPIYVSHGSGHAGPFDDPGTFDPLEAALIRRAPATVRRIRENGGTVTTHYYDGTHSWPYWERELHAAFPMLLEAIGAA